MDYWRNVRILWLLTCCFFCIRAVAQKGYHKYIIERGIRVDVFISPIRGEKLADEFREGEDVRISFKISDTVSGKSLSGVSIAAWMDRVKGNNTDCGLKIKSFIQGGILNQPDLDLNVYYVMTLNGDNTINVVNPLFGFGGSQLMTQIQLPSPGFDWVIREDQSVVYVSMPQANQVAIINTWEMKDVLNIRVPGQPGKLVLQADEHYLWVGYDVPGEPAKKSGVAVIDAENKTLVKTIITGTGPHSVTIDEGDKQVYVSNEGDGSVSVIDMKTLSVIKNINVPGGVGSMAFSTKSQSLYVVNQRAPAVSVIDGTSMRIVKDIVIEAGITKISFSPDGRNGFVINPQNNTVNIIDAATNRIVQVADVGAQPDEITFTDKLAYVRYLGTEVISMIPMDAVGKEGERVSVAEFVSGQNPPAKGSPECGAPGIVQAPGENAILISNFKDESVYYYTEGMAAASGSFSSNGKNPKAVLVVDKSIKEKATGEYETIARLGSPGAYDLALFISVPLVKECFPVTILPDTATENARLRATMGSLIIKFLPVNGRPLTGDTLNVKFQITDLITHQPVSGLRDVNMLSVLTTQNKNDRVAAVETSIKGTYECRMQISDEGLHYLYVGCPSRGLTFDNSQFKMFYASKKIIE